MPKTSQQHKNMASALTPPTASAAIIIMTRTSRQHVGMASSSNTSTIVSAAVTFHGFPRLPFELRTMIWKLGVRQVRVVEIEYIQAKYERVGSISRFVSKTLVPGLLHACAESRGIAFKRYEKVIFNGIFTGSYINWDLDYIGYKPNHSPETPDEQRQLMNALLSLPSNDVAMKCRRLIVFAYTPDIPRTVLPGELKVLEEIVALLPSDFSDMNGEGGNMNFGEMTVVDAEEQVKINAYQHANVLPSLHPAFPRLKPLNVMRYIRGHGKLLNLPEETGRGVLYPDEALLLSKPKLPKRVEFKRYRLPDLRQAAQDLGLDAKGRKKDLIPRLEAKNKEVFREEMRCYQNCMLSYSAEVETLLLEPEKPRRTEFNGGKPAQLKAAAQRTKLEDGGSEVEQVAQLRTHDEPLYLEQKKAWKLAIKDHEKMKTRVAGFKFF